MGQAAYLMQQTKIPVRFIFLSAHCIAASSNGVLLPTLLLQWQTANTAKWCYHSHPQQLHQMPTMSIWVLSISIP